jgi:formylglycine-generating enzyme required for sulfatase activity
MKVNIKYMAYSFATIMILLFITTPIQAQNRGGELEIVEPGGGIVGRFINAHALVIGESEYNNGWRRLPGVKQDVAAIKRLFEEQGFNVETIEDANSRNLKDGITNFLDQYGYDDSDARIILYFAGHGATIDLGGRKMGYIIPVDAPPARNSGDFLQTAIPMTQFETWAKQYTSRHILFIFDSCFAGSVFRSQGSAPPAINRLVSQPVRQFITSGDADEEVPDESIFRRELEHALRNGAADANDDGYVSGTELGLYLFNRVSNYMNGRQNPRVEKLNDTNLDKGDFIFSIGNPPPGVGITQGPGKTPTQRPETISGGNIIGVQTSVPANMVLVEGGTFTMGSNNGNDDEKPVHTVVVESFYIGKHEVTQKEWTEIMRSNPSAHRGDNLPVEYVSWHDAIEYCNKLSLKEGLSPCYRGNEDDIICNWNASGYRLPTEAEWEYAAKGGNKDGLIYTFSGGNNADAVAWYVGNSEKTTKPVGTKVSNSLGIYDMSGNVWEWCWDWYGSYTSGTKVNPHGPDSGENRVFRGGSVGSSTRGIRSMRRGAGWPSYWHTHVGLRVVRR